jgi:transcriptional regulator with XRE-family HTH domain
MSFSKSIKRVRIEARMTQKQFAEALGVSFTTVNRWENRKTLPSFPTVKAIESFCNERGIDFDIKSIQEV